MASQTNMTYVRLGKSGLRVSQIILGCMSYGSPKWQNWVIEEDESIKQIEAAYKLGINAFDTADVYSNGLSETTLGKAIKQLNLPRAEIVVMTKVFFTSGRKMDDGFVMMGREELDRNRYVNVNGLSRKHIFDSVKGSLERLQLDYIDVLQCHRFDPDTPIEETMNALHDVMKAGYVRYIGMSSCWAWQFHKMQNYAKRHGLTEFISMQNYYNAIYREEEREMMPLLQDLGVGCIPWSPLARGFLTKPVTETSLRNDTDMMWSFREHPSSDPAAVEINKRVAVIAERRKISMAQVALAWQISKPWISAPIVGTTSNAKLEDLVAGVHVKLTQDEIKSIDEPYRAMTPWV